MIQIKDLKLHDLVDSSSLSVMNMLKVDEMLLDIDLDQWESNNIVNEAKSIVSNIPCSIDVCENRVQLASTYNCNGPRKEDDRQKYYITINESRKSMPSTALKDLKNTQILGVYR